jgi:HEAT repeat protein
MNTRIAVLLALAVALPAAPMALAQTVNPRATAPAQTSDEEALALAALEGLMSAPPERALPILKRVIFGGHSTKVKERALFVLSQIDAPESQQILIEIVKQPDHPLRREAIRNIGIGGHAASIAVLRDVYASGDEKTQKWVLEAWLIADRRADVYQAARDAKTEREADRAIQTLAAMGAREELRKLATERTTTKSLMEAYAVSGDLESLTRIANTAPDVETRAQAVQRMGIVGSPAAKKALRDAYLGASDPKVKSAALQGLLVAGDQKIVLELYRAAKTPEEKRQLMRTMSVMGGDMAIDAIDEALGGKK